MSRLMMATRVVCLTCLGSLWLGCDDTSCPESANLCDVEGEVRCSQDGASIEVCDADESGCLHWSVQQACPSLMTCVDNGREPRCQCVNSCNNPGTSECDGDVARFCRENDAGCLYWFDTNCGLMEQSCVMTSGLAGCMADCESNCFRLDATRCGSETDIETCSKITDGCLQWQVTNSCSNEAEQCDDSGDDALCVEVCLSECDAPGTVVCSEEGDVETCIDTGDDCLLWELTLDCDEGQLCEDRRGALGCFYEHNCDDGLDDDNDGAIDCDDDECFGLDPSCLVETNCRDAADNDLDSMTDCDDDDCAEGVDCVTFGIWELFHVDAENDLEGCTLTFTPLSSAPQHYEVESVCPCTIDWLDAPGSGDLTTLLELGDDDGQEVTPTELAGVTFFEQVWASFHVGSNGFITFGEEDVDASSSTDAFHELPRIAPLDVDLDPSGGGVITVDEWDDRIAVSFEAVPHAGSPEITSSFQLVIDGTGTITFVLYSLGDRSRGFVGISNGVSTGEYPDQVDFTTRTQPPANPGDIIFTELLFDPLAAEDDAGEFIELHNRTATDLDIGCCLLSDGVEFHELGALSIAAGEPVVLARSSDVTNNGGIDDAYAFGEELVLDDLSPAELTLECDGVIIDGLSLSEALWPAGSEGVSMQLSSLAYLDVLNDDSALWCDSIEAFGEGDLGTPGSVNGDCSPLVYVIEDFEDDPGWGTTGDWEWGHPDVTFLDGPTACAAGLGCYGTSMAGDYTVDHAGSSNVLIAGPIDLSDLSTAYLRFSLWLDTELNSDGHRVVVADDGGVTSFVSPITTPAYNTPEGDSTMWSGDYGDLWFTVVMDLTPIVGEETAYIFWELGSDSENTAAGAYVDDVELLGF